MDRAAISLSPNALARMELFLGLPAPALADVLGCARVRHLAKDAIVFGQGQAADRCHAVIEGRVRIAQSDPAGAQLLVRFVGPGEMFGTVALFTDRLYPAEATAVTNCVEISWTEPTLLGLIDRHPRIAVNILRVVGARLREVQERLRELATQRVERRIAHVLLRLAAQAGQSEGTGTVIGFPLTRKDVAEMCGATLHTVSRTLTAWEKAGWVRTSRQRVTILKSNAIRRIAEDPAASDD